MMTTVRYPIAFKALPQRCAGVKTVYCTFPHQCDVPEIGMSETTAVAEFGTDTRHALLEYGDRLYRKMGNPEQVVRQMDTAFENPNRRDDPWVFAFEGGQRTDDPPPSRPLDNLVAFRTYVEAGVKGVDQDGIWPYQPTGRGRYREEFHYEQLERRLVEIDGASFTKAREEHVREGERLLVVDGVYWIETPPPVIMVSLEGTRTTERASLQLVHLPDWIDRDLSRQYFPLTRHEEALEWAMKLNHLRSHGHDPLEDYSREMEVSSTDHPLLDFDHAGHSVRRTAFVLASDAARWLDTDGAANVKAGQKAVDTAYRVRDMAVACGTDMSDRPDVADMVPDIVKAWKATARKPGWAVIPTNRLNLGNAICERAEEMAADMPISVDTTMGWEPKP